MTMAIRLGQPHLTIGFLPQIIKEGYLAVNVHSERGALRGMLIRREVALASTPADGRFPLREEYKDRSSPKDLLQSFLRPNPSSSLLD